MIISISLSKNSSTLKMGMKMKLKRMGLGARLWEGIDHVYGRLVARMIPGLWGLRIVRLALSTGHS